MRVVAVQSRLRELAVTRDIPELAELADQLSRRSVERRAPNASTKMTAELRGRIRAYALATPAASQAEIGRKFNVNPGRVSEALRGVRQ